MVIIQLNEEQLNSAIYNAVRKAMGDTPSQTPPPDPNELLTVTQAANFLSLAVPTIYSMISRGELPVIKKTKRCYFMKSDLIAYLKQGRKRTISEIEEEAHTYLGKTGTR